MNRKPLTSKKSPPKGRPTGKGRAFANRCTIIGGGLALQGKEAIIVSRPDKDTVEVRLVLSGNVYTIPRQWINK